MYFIKIFGVIQHTALVYPHLLFVYNVCLMKVSTVSVPEPVPVSRSIAESMAVAVPVSQSGVSVVQPVAVGSVVALDRGAVGQRGVRLVNGGAVGQRGVVGHWGVALDHGVARGRRLVDAAVRGGQGVLHHRGGDIRVQVGGVGRRCRVGVGVDAGIACLGGGDSGQEQYLAA